MGSVQCGSPEPNGAIGIGKGLSKLRDTERMVLIFDHLLWFLGLDSRLPICYVSILSLAYGPGLRTLCTQDMEDSYKINM